MLDAIKEMKRRGNGNEYYLDSIKQLGKIREQNEKEDFKEKDKNPENSKKGGPKPEPTPTEEEAESFTKEEMAKMPRKNLWPQAKDLVPMLQYIQSNTQKDDEPEEIKNLRKIKEEIDEYCKDGKPFPIGDIHGDPVLFVSYMVLSGNATLDKDKPIVEKIVKGRDDNNCIVETFNLKPNHDCKNKIVFLGDYIDRGPDSENILYSLIDFLKLQKNAELENVIPILGNHDTGFLRKGYLNPNNFVFTKILEKCLKDEGTNIEYDLENPMESENKILPALQQKLKDNLDLFKLCYLDDKGRIYTHAQALSESDISYNDINFDKQLEDYIANTLKFEVNSERLDAIENEINKRISDPSIKTEEDTKYLKKVQNLKVLKSLVDFYKKDFSSYSDGDKKEEAKKFEENYNKLLEMAYSDSGIDKNTKRIIVNEFIKKLQRVRSYADKAKYAKKVGLQTVSGHTVKEEKALKDKDADDSNNFRDVGASAFIKYKNILKETNSYFSEKNKFFENPEYISTFYTGEKGEGLHEINHADFGKDEVKEFLKSNGIKILNEASTIPRSVSELTEEPTEKPVPEELLKAGKGKKDEQKIPETGTPFNIEEWKKTLPKEVPPIPELKKGPEPESDSKKDETKNIKEKNKDKQEELASETNHEQNKKEEPTPENLKTPKPENSETNETIGKQQENNNIQQNSNEEQTHTKPEQSEQKDNVQKHISTPETPTKPESNLEEKIKEVKELFKSSLGNSMPEENKNNFENISI